MNIHVKRLFVDCQLLDNQIVEIEEGKILNIQPYANQLFDFTFENLSAGLFDTHINGGFKFYFTQHPTLESVADIADASRQSGTAYVLPTLITSSLQNILKGIDATKAYQKLHPNGGVLGMHLEGHFLSVKKRGAHLEKYIRKPTNAELDQILERGEGVIKLMTIAPEEFTDAQLNRLVDSEIAISVGHTNASYEQAKRAFSKGISLVTHLYNAMSGLQHRAPGVVGATLEDNSVYAPIILDGHHCHFGAAKVAYRAKKDKLFLISDALFLGKKMTEFRWNEFDATLVNGSYVNSEGNLAGGAISLGNAIQNAVNSVQIPVEEAIEMASYRPAAAIGITDKIGKIAVGFPAVFTSFDNELTNFKVIDF